MNYSDLLKAIRERQADLRKDGKNLKGWAIEIIMEEAVDEIEKAERAE